ncbi:WhiB family transcriptional regulator [Streptomyces sp. NPDC056500]|uniref:WhiB family transcriptional regulator n=1 Tax=Streptomyces sp. NPDC056500 TaxID=3345840 RepID=UPI00369CEA1E
MHDWYAHALCSGADPELFFPLPNVAEAQEAKRICFDCPVRTQCLDHALNHPENDGIWAGTSARERRRLRTNRSTHPERSSP